ncbi:MAG: D-2-hydroxyacid dehydrogenase [Treponema sp.]|nr:D-2-hydroxyacid dehydrogenase [Treponema sp.]
MKIVVLDGYTENPGDLSWEGFEKIGDLKVYDRSPANDEDETIRRIGDAEAVITNKTQITKKVIESCPHIKYLGILATGYNNVDGKAARARGIPFTNIPTYGTAAVGQFAFALLLEICHRIGHHDGAVKSGRWESCPDFCFWDYPLIELEGKNFGIIGLGRIGKAAAKIAGAMGMEVIAYDIAQTEEGAKVAKYVTQDELYARADVVSLHCPLFPENTGLINKESIAKMKDGVIIINTARGPLIAEQDLADALNSGKVYAAGIDVVSAEPIRGDNPLLKAKNCFITPHIAWAAKASRSRLMDIAVSNLKAFLDGKPVNVVN